MDNIFSEFESLFRVPSGLELSEKYWNYVALPEFEKKCPEVLNHCTVGLVGEGSECFGFDDDISKDHDWGPGFCMWLSDESMAKYGETAKSIYASLPSTYMGFSRLRVSDLTLGRVGIHNVNSFYYTFLGYNKLPSTNMEWNRIPEYGLAAATNGKIFLDADSEFSGIRSFLLRHYPEDVMKKKLAYHCASAAQAGQYNLYRCLQRNDHSSTLIACSEFVTHIQSVIFLINKRYKPYYKWSGRMLKTLPYNGQLVAGMLDDIATFPKNLTDIVERTSSVIIGMLNETGLSNISGDFLMDHAFYVQSTIEDPDLRSLSLMQE